MGTGVSIVVVCILVLYLSNPCQARYELDDFDVYLNRKFFLLPSSEVPPNHVCFRLNVHSAMERFYVFRSSSKLLPEEREREDKWYDDHFHIDEGVLKAFEAATPEEYPFVQIQHVLKFKFTPGSQQQDIGMNFVEKDMILMKKSLLYNFPWSFKYPYHFFGDNVYTFNGDKIENEEDLGNGFTLTTRKWCFTLLDKYKVPKLEEAKERKQTFKLMLEKGDNFDRYLNRKYVLLPRDNEFPHIVCFRWSFNADLNEDIGFTTTNFTMEQDARQHASMMTHIQLGTMKKAMNKEKEGKAKCNSMMTEYYATHKLPEDWENGAPLNYYDCHVIVSKKMFEFNYPLSCEIGDKIHKYFEFYSRPIFQQDGKVSGNIKEFYNTDCFKLMDLSEIPIQATNMNFNQPKIKIVKYESYDIEDE